MAYRKRIGRATTEATYAALHGVSDLVDNLKKQGLCVHNALVNKTFTVQPRTKDAGAVQVPDDSLLVACATEAEAILRANAIQPYISAHFDDAKYAHTAADPTSKALLSAPDATDSASLTTKLVAMRLAVNSHFITTTGHNRILNQLQVVTVPIDAATNLAVMNTILLLLQSHWYSAAESYDLDPI